MTTEEELLYYLKRTSDIFAAHKEYIHDPEFEERYEEMQELMSLLLDIIESRKKGENKYDYTSDEMLDLKERIIQLAGDVEHLSEELS